MWFRESKKMRLIIGWIAVSLITLVACLWALWGTIENFHEGWWRPTLLGRLTELFVQYLSFTLITVGIGILAIRWPRIGGGLLLLISAILSAWIFRDLPQMNFIGILSWLPVTGLPILVGILFLFGQPHPRKWAYLVVAGMPLLVIVICAIGPLYRIAGRIDDGNREVRLVEGNGVRLIWAPTGPGWIRSIGRAFSWEEARKQCRFLSMDGKSLTDNPQNIWRLPTVDEAVRSMMRHGHNCGGQWDSKQKQATYDIRPDKESPLWDTTSPIIYWWTATEVDDEHSFIITYQGSVYPRNKQFKINSLGFRAVKTIDYSHNEGLTSE